MLLRSSRFGDGVVRVSRGGSVSPRRGGLPQQKRLLLGAKNVTAEFASLVCLASCHATTEIDVRQSQGALAGGKLLRRQRGDGENKGTAATPCVLSAHARDLFGPVSSASVRVSFTPKSKLLQAGRAVLARFQSSSESELLRNSSPWHYDITSRSHEKASRASQACPVPGWIPVKWKVALRTVRRDLHWLDRTGPCRGKRSGWPETLSRTPHFVLNVTAYHASLTTHTSRPSSSHCRPVLVGQCQAQE